MEQLGLKAVAAGAALENEVDMSEFSAVMRQYLEIKEANRDALVFFRLGDFYELFFDDARLAADKLGLTLTSRDTGRGKSPMCGVPHHAAEGYILRLVDMGYRIALVEQVGEAQKGGIMRREVVRTYTRGTVVNDTDSRASYIAAVCQERGESAIGLAFCDIATGEFLITFFDNDVKFIDELHKIAPVEIIVNADFGDIQLIESNMDVKPTVYHSWAFHGDHATSTLLSHFGVKSLDGFGIDSTAAISAAGALIQYLGDMQAAALAHITGVSPYAVTDFMVLDKNARRNLELTASLRDGDAVGSLLWVLDYTKTMMGKRLLQKWLLNPLLNISDIACRQQAVAEFVKNAQQHGEIRTTLARIPDLERLCAKLNYRRIGLGDIAALGRAIAAITDVKRLLADFNSQLNAYFAENIDVLPECALEILRAIGDSQDFLPEYDSELDRLRALKSSLLEQIDALETREREGNGIKSLKIGHNKVFGYYFEVGNNHRDALPERFKRRQTLVGSERYVTDELKQLEVDLLSVIERITETEAGLFDHLLAKIVSEIPRIRLSANMLASIDVLQSLAEAARQYNYVCPEMIDIGLIDIKEGRHPVVERLTHVEFTPNDTYLDNYDSMIAIVTGPNMAGKSTFLRQVALICIMAQMGGFVPATAARLPICDRIFARVGASDDLLRGQSTFMVEMHEVAVILNNATESSLIILDEVGRGTSTADGFAIAMAIVEYISAQIRAKTLFSTHFHELTVMEGNVNGVFNLGMLVKEEGENITFLRKVAHGGASKSYGIAVAKFAGLPTDVVKRSDQIQSTRALHEAYIDAELAKGITTLRQRMRLYLEETDIVLTLEELRACKEWL